MNDKQGLSPDQVQAKLANLKQSTGHEAEPGAPRRDVEITVASQRDAFDLKACQALLKENGIPSKLVGRGFHQIVVVTRADSGRSIDLIAAHREQLLRTNPLSAGDYVVGIVAWALGCGLFLPGLALWFVWQNSVHAEMMAIVATNLVIVAPIMVAGSVLLGGFLGYLRCRAIASRRRK